MITLIAEGNELQSIQVFPCLDPLGDFLHLARDAHVAQRHHGAAFEADSDEAIVISHLPRRKV